MQAADTCALRDGQEKEGLSDQIRTDGAFYMYCCTVRFRQGKGKGKGKRSRDRQIKADLKI